MKKFLKKLGVFGLICAVLSPFASIPKVNAEEDDCDEHYLNQYLFLDVTNGNSWEHYLRDEGSRTYTTFLYTFPTPAEGRTIRIDKVGSLNLIDSDFEKLKNFRSAWATTEALGTTDRKLEEQTSRLGISDEYGYYTNKYESITYVLHGYWGFDGQKYIEAKYSSENKNDFSEINFAKHTIQGVLIEKDNNNNDFSASNFRYKVDFSGASLINNRFNAVYNEYSGYGDETDADMDDYFSQIVKDVNDGLPSTSPSAKKNFVWKNDGNYYFNIGIERTIDSADELNKLNLGYDSKDANGNIVKNIWSTSNSSYDESYTAFRNYANHCVDKDNNGKCDGTLANTIDATQPDGDYCTGNYECYLKPETTDETIDINTSEAYYWPVILNVEYSLCSTTGGNTGGNNGGNNGGGTQEPAKDKWTLKYDDNVEGTGVTNMPDPLTQEAEVGTGLKVSDTKPKRDGYSFNGWKLCNGTDTYKSGDEIKPTSKTTVELCAQWGAEGTSDNPKQGVISYVIGFASVGVVAGAIYLISKKKNLFKQI